MTFLIPSIEPIAREEESLRDSGDRPATYHSRSSRALGQALEKFGFSTFELEIRYGAYLIVAKPRSPERTHFSLTRLLGQLFQPPPIAARLLTVEHKPDLRFSPEDIETFDLRGKNRRKDGGKIPDPYGVSELLRGAGCYLDNRNIKSDVTISLVDRWVTIRYQAGDGRTERIERDIEYFYDYGVNMYLRRSNRLKPVAQTS